MYDTCHECGERIGVRDKVMGVLSAQTPHYSSAHLLWSELSGAEILLLFHPERMEKMWLQKTEERLPEVHSHDVPKSHEKQPN